MKIQRAFFACLYIAALLAQGTSASVQARGFISKNALPAPSVAHLVPGPRDEAEHPPEEHHRRTTQDTTLWPEISNLNVKFTWLLATVWVLLLGSTPLFIYWVGEKPVTKSAIVLSSLLWAALFGGLYLFTQIILFNSPHFDKVRSLTVIECTYFMTQVITTVGYGDITPAKPRGQVFVGLYVVLAFFVIALLMSEMQMAIMEKLKAHKEHLTTHAASMGLKPFGRTDSNVSNLAFKPEKPSPEKLLESALVFLGIAVVWVMFFVNYPGEGKAWGEATYMALITLTTVGFGAVTPVTEGGMIFGAFFMFIGTAALCNVIKSFSELILEMDQWESWSGDQFAKDLKKFKDGLESGHDISESEFLTFALVQKGLVEQGQIDAIKASYTAMTNHKGRCSVNAIAVFHEVHDHEHLKDEIESPQTTGRSPHQSSRSNQQSTNQ